MSLHNFEFHNPWILLLALPALALLAWRWRRRAGVAAIVFPSVARLKGFRPTVRQRLRWIVPALEVVALLGLIAAAARPRQGDARTVVRNEGIAIQMVLDRSGSMEEEVLYQGRMRRKIDIVKEVFADFVGGGGGLPGRKTDLIGLTTFARFTEENCPLVTTYEPLLSTVKNLTTVAPFLDQYDQTTWNQSAAAKENPLNATAIGDGLKRAILSLVTAEDDLARGEKGGGYKIKGKVIILLTDGKNNAGSDPTDAGRYAKENGIRIYYVLLRELVERRRTVFGSSVVKEYSPEELLEEPQAVVSACDGKAYLARDGNELLEVYSEIDALERTDVGKIEFKSYHERYHWFLVPAVALAFVAFLLKETFFRSIP